MGEGRVFRTVRRLTAWLRPFVAMRDGILVVGAGLYAIGYLMWSLYAWEKGLGLLPILSAQYLAAGVTMALVLALGLIVLLVPPFIRAWLHAWFKTKTETRLTIRWAIAFSAYFTIIGFFLIICLSPFLVPTGRFPHIFLFVFFSLFIFGYFYDQVKRSPLWVVKIDICLAKSRSYCCVRKYLVEKILPQFDIFAKASYTFAMFYLWIVVPLACALLGYAAFERLPQEFGGAAPGCTHLDVDRTMLSKEAQQELLAGSDASNFRVARTIKLDLLFAGGDSLLVRRHDRQTPRVYAIGSKFVTATADCD